MPAKEFDVVRSGIVLNLNQRYCHSSVELLESEGFDSVFSRFIAQSKENDTIAYRYVVSCCDERDLKENLISLFKLLSYQMIDDENKHLLPFLKDTEKFISFIEELYNYWLKIERYAVLYNDRPARSGLQRNDLIPAIDSLTNLIIETRRQIKERISHRSSLVLRQSRSSINAGLSLGNVSWECPTEYSFLKEVPFIEKLVLMPPFIVYPKKNTRDGFFNVVDKNPLANIRLDNENWFCYPIKVGDLLTFVYFPRDFMSQGVTLCNLFETASVEDYVNRKPDMIYVYACDDGDDKVKTLCYHDEKNDIMVGLVNRNNAIDYFGYMKKMLLTLHNLKAIHRKELPIHGAMVSITMKNGIHKNVVIMGDSGAGKSESLEAFRALAGDYLQKMVIVFDDMGIFRINADSKPIAYGTEIGAFVRLDDLDQGYAFKELDRSIFMNPDKINARVIIPVATYTEIMRGEPVDYFLYANNYDDPTGESLSFFENAEEAKPTFVDGKRMAKGTTTEKGITTSFFANPFGPVQKEKETRVLIDQFFDDMFKKGVKVGQIYTRLGVSGKEQEGPKEAAKYLFELLMNDESGRIPVK
ncbi:MAG: phosphoenolpyruvate carboxykinase [Brevinema sp.]